MNALLDTNVLIDYLNGIAAAREEINRYPRPLISLITWMEVLAGTSAEHDRPVRGFLRRFDCTGIDVEIAERAVKVRKDERLKLPDAIIRATALERGVLLVTRNTKDFSADEPGVRVPYTLQGQLGGH